MICIVGLAVCAGTAAAATPAESARTLGRRSITNVSKGSNTKSAKREVLAIGLVRRETRGEEPPHWRSTTHRWYNVPKARPEP